jgi:hypothetical protein
LDSGVVLGVSQHRRRDEAAQWQADDQMAQSEMRREKFFILGHRATRLADSVLREKIEES